MPDNVDAQRPADNVQEPDKFNPREFALRLSNPVHGVRANIFDFAPKLCGGCALWLRSSCNRLVSGWNRLACLFQEKPELHLSYLRHYQWVPFQIEDRAWQVPYGKLIKIEPALDKLSYLYILPNIEDSRLHEPAQARRLVMDGLEILNDAGVDAVAMNGIHGDPHELEDLIANVMVKAARDWIDDMHRSPRSIEDIYLVDLKGGFNAANKF